jgi:hypothetical protein
MSIRIVAAVAAEAEAEAEAEAITRNAEIRRFKVLLFNLLSHFPPLDS